MFAESLSKLKKRATEIVKDAVREKDDTNDKEDDFFDGGGAVGCGLDGSLFVRYEVQNGSEADQDGAMFILPSSGADPSLAHMRKHFPLTGRFHFRFKTPSLDGSGGWFWADLANDNGSVPVYGGQVLVKALKLPDDAAPLRSFQEMPGSALAGGAQLGGLSFSAPPRRAAASPGLAPSAGLGGGLDGLEMPQELPRAPSPPVRQQPSAPSPASSPSPAADLMGFDVDFGGGGGAPAPPAPARPMGGSPAPAAAPAPAPPPVVMPDRATLVAEREAKEKARVEEHTKRMKEEKEKEDKMKKDKASLSFAVAEEMDKWAKTADGQGFKDIRTLISTVHTVIWKDSTWQSVSLSELIANDSNVKKYYRKAIIACHPDRHQEADAEQQVRADRIFQALNEAFKAGI
mmetsp:Transcript_4170/g.12139  ORF Transcript_4170/g.12139 Transcript_4170/m.12139 type:complete len:403 (+) Transcript_4170:150-1358(+)